MARRQPVGLWRRSPRPWHGMTVRPWLCLLVRNRFAVSPGRWPMALAVTTLAPLNATAAALQRRRHGRVIAGAIIDPPPVFIVGHWRTGTTMLHELLALDPQFRCPTTYECMAPAHFMVTGRLVTSFLGRLLPPHRPLDDMRLRWDLPQEDEFALTNLGLPGPYDAFAFPRRAAAWEECLDPRDFAPAERERWQEALLAFAGALLASHPGRLALKSPPHTARIGLLAETFPGAAFVHTVRHPFQMVPSFLAAWPRMAEAVGLQSRCREDLDHTLLDLGAALYRRFDADCAGLAPGRLVDVRYEDLARDPAAALGSIYDRLGLPHADRIPGAVEAYRAQVGAYRPAAHDPSPELRRAIAQRWSGYATRYGYSLDSSTP